MTDAAAGEAKAKKPWHKKWWVWTVAGLVLIGAISSIVNPSPKVAIPEVAGLTAIGAKAQLEAAGFRVTVEEDGKFSGGGAKFDALGTDPTAGTEAAKGSKVTLQVHEATERLASEAAEAERLKAEEDAEREAEKVRAGEEARAKAAETAAQPLTEDYARPFCLDYAERAFPYGVNVHYMAGVLAEEKTETGWFMKYKADIKNEYGAKRKANIECHMSGTNGAPVMDDFLDY